MEITSAIYFFNKRIIVEIVFIYKTQRARCCTISINWQIYKIIYFSFRTWIWNNFTPIQEGSMSRKLNIMTWLRLDLLKFIRVSHSRHCNYYIKLIKILVNSFFKNSIKNNIIFIIWDWFLMDNLLKNIDLIDMIFFDVMKRRKHFCLLDLFLKILVSIIYLLLKFIFYYL